MVLFPQNEKGKRINFKNKLFGRKMFFWGIGNGSLFTE